MAAVQCLHSAIYHAIAAEPSPVYKIMQSRDYISRVFPPYQVPCTGNSGSRAVAAAVTGWPANSEMARAAQVQLCDACLCFNY